MLASRNGDGFSATVPLAKEGENTLTIEATDAAGVRPDYVFRSQDNGAVQGMVRSGMGRAMMPYLAIDPDEWIPAGERKRWAALPDTIELKGEEYPLDYAVEDGVGVVRARIPEKVLPRLDEASLPALDPWHGAWFHPYSFVDLTVTGTPAASARAAISS